MLRQFFRLFDFKGRRRRRVAARPFPPEWSGIIDRNVPMTGTLSPDERRELEGRVLVFLDEKTFEGVGGLTMTNEIRVTIAAQACLLLLGRETDDYPTLSSIIVYPNAYVAESTRRLPDGTVFEGPQARLGESWHRGNVVLSWDDVRHGAADIRDGHNVVLHEFAHQLDSESGGVEGAPVLPRRSMYAAWARVLGREYEATIQAVEAHRPTFLDPYAATSPAEFFAVATEFFFERSEQLKVRHPELYEQLRLFYQQDPAARVDARRTG